MDEINMVTVLFVFYIFTNVGWLILLSRTNNNWYKRLLELNDLWGNYYKEIIRDISNGEDKKDERNNVL